MQEEVNILRRNSSTITDYTRHYKRGTRHAIHIIYISSAHICDKWDNCKQCVNKTLVLTYNSFFWFFVSYMRLQLLTKCPPALMHMATYFMHLMPLCKYIYIYTYIIYAKILWEITTWEWWNLCALSTFASLATTLLHPRGKLQTHLTLMLRPAHRCGTMSCDSHEWWQVPVCTNPVPSTSKQLNSVTTAFPVHAHACLTHAESQ